MQNQPENAVIKEVCYSHYVSLSSGGEGGTQCRVRGKVNGGFTLIELLVVILIIGILAAVAIPQYNKAVWKSRAVEAVQVINTLQKAISLYRLQTTNTDEAQFLGENANVLLDIEVDLTSCDDRYTGCSSHWQYTAMCEPLAVDSICTVRASPLAGEIEEISTDLYDSTGQWSNPSAHYCGTPYKPEQQKNCEVLESLGLECSGSSCSES